MKTLLSTLAIATMLACGGEDKKPPLFTKPAGTIAVGIQVDDTANKVFSDNQLQWKGSMIFDSATQKVTKDSNWGGPFAPMFDDGSWTNGGHEPAGATAGDHIFGTVVFVTPPAAGSAADTYEYGLNDGTVVATGRLVGPNGWSWPPGPNGSFTVAAGTTADIKADGLTLKKFGTTDIQFVIDKNALASGTWDSTKVTIKGSAWGWNEIQLLDDGTLGDATTADGKFTFQEAQFAGSGKVLPHAGLPNSGDKPEFIVVFNGKEYKDGSGNALATGITAGVKASGASSYTTVAIALNSGNKNTYITVP